MERVVITGAGCCTSLGWEAGGIARSFAEGRTAFASDGGRPVCPVADTGGDAASARLGAWRHRRYLNRGALFAVLSGLRAAASAGYDPEMPPETCLIGAAGPMLDFGRERGLPPADPADLDALWLLRWLPNTANAALARFLGIHGEGLVIGTACASALQAMGEGFRRVRSGLSARVLVAAGDSRLSEGGLLGYGKAHALSRNPVPEAAARPFDAARDGFVPGEGGAAFVLEPLEAARSRNARIVAEVLGFGASLDGGALTAPDESARYAERAVRDALADAGCAPGEVDWVSAHGTGTPLNDRSEALLLERVFADARPAVTALKSWIGHGSAACGGMELALLLAAARGGMLPPVRNLCEPCSARVDFVRSPRPFPGPVGLLENFGFGGQNAALAVRLWR